MARQQPRKLSDQLRAAISNSGVSRYRISKETGIDQASLEKFVNRKRAGLSMRSLDLLAEYLGLTITAQKRKRR